MEKLLTVSVAAYNVEQFLSNTLKSLEDPRYVEKIEVFVVDDGGKDKSLEIAKSFEARFPGTFHAVHKENGGYGSTVNYSLAHATGKYFKLLDGDDWFDQDGLNNVLMKLESCEDDVVITDYYIGPSESDLNVISTGADDDSIVNVKDYETSYPHGMWAIFFKTDVLRQSNLVLPEHSLYTDQIYSTVPFAYANTIRFYNIPVYCYRFGRVEQSTSKPSRIKHSDEMLAVCNYLYDFYENHKDNNKYLLCRVSRYYVVALKTLMILPINQENKKRLVTYEIDMQIQHREIYSDAVNSNRWGKIITVLRKSNYRLYWLLKMVPEKYFL